MNKSPIDSVFDFEAKDGDGCYYFYTIAEDYAGNEELYPGYPEKEKPDDSTFVDVYKPLSEASSPN